MKNAILFFLISLAPNKFYSQIIEFIEGYNYGGSSIDYSYDINWAADSTIVQAGLTWSNDYDVTTNQGLSDFWIINSDTNGNLITQKTYGGSQTEGWLDFIRTNDSGYIFIGYTYSSDGNVSFNHGSSDFWVMKTDNSFNLVWEKTYGGSGEDWGSSIIISNDNNYLIGGFSSSSDGDVALNKGATDYLLIKINELGEIIWEKTYGGSDYDYLRQINQAPTGEITLIGETQSGNGDIVDFNGGSDIWVVKLDEEGLLLSSHCFGSSDFETNISGVVFNNKIAITSRIQGIGGDITEYNGGFYDIWIIFVSSDGSIAWQNSIGGSEIDQPFGISIGNSNNFIICGETHSNDGDVSFLYDGLPGSNDAWVISVDTMGSIIWEKTLGGYYGDNARGAIVDNNDTYYISNVVGSYDGMVEETNGSIDVWLAKLRYCNGTHFYADIDNDGFGDLLNDTIICDQPVGYVLDSTDCNDSNISVFPTALDICNNLDDNCNGSIDEDALFISWFADNDADLFGNPEMDSVSCFELVGYVENNTDCNDSIATLNPLSNETCNAIDDNCNTLIDEDLVIYTFFADTDGDTYGDPFYEIDTCVEMVIGFVNNNLDCTDTNALIFPGAIELCNYIDDDCDGLSDDNLIYLVSYQDADGDNFGNLLIDSAACTIPEGFVADSTDCNDTNAAIYPGAIETLNGLDDDCDQLSDEGLAIANTAYGFTVYPNPTTGLIIIENAIGISASIQIVNTLGQIIYMSAFINATTQIDITAFAAGLYVLKVMTGYGDYNYQIIKQ